MLIVPPRVKMSRVKMTTRVRRIKMSVGGEGLGVGTGRSCASISR